MKPEKFTLHATVYPARHYLPEGADIREYTVVVEITERLGGRDGRLQEAKMIGRAAVGKSYAREHGAESEDKNYVVEISEHPIPWDQPCPPEVHEDPRIILLLPSK
jgi:hypothetical protein